MSNRLQIWYRHKASTPPDVDYKNTRYLSVNTPELFFGLFRVGVRVRVRVGVRVGVRVRVNSVTETNYQDRKIIRVN